MRIPFLHKKYPELHKSSEVESAVKRKEIREKKKIGKNVEAVLKTYLERLEEVFNSQSSKDERERKINILKKKIFQLFVIKPENISENYFEFQRKILKQLGYGNVEITDTSKKEATKTIINDQKQSLSDWIDYLGSDEAKYPTWFKYFVFRNIVKLSEYDKNKKEFKKRSKSTTGLFPHIDRSSLAYIYDVLSKYHIKNQKIEDKELENIVKSSNFAKLYGYFIEKKSYILKEEKESIKGKWVKYEQGSDFKPLYESLQIYDTGWCTAGKETSKTQLELGDFYVYYTWNDIQKDYINPRIAIRMQSGEIAEVRGINPGQELEPLLLNVAEKKMKTLPGAQEYKKKTSDMKKLTVIEEKVEKKEDLTLDELRFLYEIDSSIEGFGHKKDPRIEEIKSKRDKKQDYAVIFDVPAEQVALDLNEFNKNTRLFEGDLDKSSLDILESLDYSLIITGSLTIKDCPELAKLPDNLSVGED